MCIDSLVETFVLNHKHLVALSSTEFCFAMPGEKFVRDNIILHEASVIKLPSFTILGVLNSLFR